MASIWQKRASSTAGALWAGTLLPSPPASPLKQQNHASHWKHFSFNAQAEPILWWTCLRAPIPAARYSRLSRHLSQKYRQGGQSRACNELQALTGNKQHNPTRFSAQHHSWEVSLRCLLRCFIQQWYTASHHTRHRNLRKTSSDSRQAY